MNIEITLFIRYLAKCMYLIIYNCETVYEKYLEL